MESTNAGSAAAIIAGLGIFFIFFFAIMIFFIVCTWKIFKKAGKEGWECIVPIYNIIVFLDIIKRPRWWILLYFIPLVSFIVAIVNCLDMAKAFGKSSAFGIGLLLLSPIFYPILAFGDSVYILNGSEDLLINEIQEFK